jgi:hypothetical protein
MKNINNDLYKNASGYSDPTAAKAIINADKCFANFNGSCKILNIDKCLGEECRFLKTKEQLYKEQRKSLEKVEIK